MLRELLYLNKSDRKVLLLLFAVAAVALLVITWDEMSADDSSPKDALADSTLSIIQQPATDATEHMQAAYAPTTKTRLSTFDPNTADSTELCRLGLRPPLIRNILHYRQAGGVFHKKTDFARIYGLTQKEYHTLEPYIRISADYRLASEMVTSLHTHGATTDTTLPYPAPSSTRYPTKLKAGQTIDLNQLDTTQLMRVPGIGSYYARRIVTYGERLGGYTDSRQLLEIDDFPAESLPFFTINSDSIRRMNINQLSLAQLKRHPYLDYYQSRAIIDYRRKHGAIRSIDELRLLPEFDATAIQRLRPYITY